MKKFSIIQPILLSVAGIALIIAVFMFAFYRGGSSDSALGQVTIWGTIPQELFNELIRQESTSVPDVFGHVIYVEKDQSTFGNEFVTALAEGTAPDLVILRENQIVENKNRLAKIPFENFDKRTFQETYIEEANLLIEDDGYLGIPFAVDPMVLYYNKDTLNSAGIARPPQTWTELLSIAPQLTVSDSAFNVSKSVIALGNFFNINNAKEITWALIMQAGNNVVERSNTESAKDTNGFVSVLDDSKNYSIKPAVAALNFFTQFSNPSKTIYSWNGSMPNSEEFFLAGNSAFYLGFSSELTILRRKNPNLNFDVAEIPQSKNSTGKTTYGKMYFLGIARTSRKIPSAYQTSILLTSRDLQEKLVRLSGNPSIRRDLLVSSDPKSTYQVIFNRSALISKGVLEPSSKSADQIVSKMIQSTVAGELEISDAVNKAGLQINEALKK